MTDIAGRGDDTSQLIFGQLMKQLCAATLADFFRPLFPAGNFAAWNTLSKIRSGMTKALAASL